MYHLSNFTLYFTVTDKSYTFFFQKKYCKYMQACTIAHLPLKDKPNEKINASSYRMKNGFKAVYCN